MHACMQIYSCVCTYGVCMHIWCVYAHMVCVCTYLSINRFWRWHHRSPWVNLDLEVFLCIFTAVCVHGHASIGVLVGSVLIGVRANQWNISYLCVCKFACVLSMYICMMSIRSDFESYVYVSCTYMYMCVMSSKYITYVSKNLSLTHIETSLVLTHCGLTHTHRAWVHPNYWNEKHFIPNNAKLPALMSFIGASRFAYIRG